MILGNSFGYFESNKDDMMILQADEQRISQTKTEESFFPVVKQELIRQVTE